MTNAAAFYDLLVVSVLTLVAGALALVACTLLHHGVRTLRLRRQARRRQVLLPLVCRAIAHPGRREELEAAVRRSDAGVLLPLLVQLALDLRGEDTQTLAGLADTLGLVAQERRRLRSRSRNVRAEAAKHLGLLRARVALPELLHRVKADKRANVRAACAWAIGEIGGRKSVLGLLSLLEDPDASVVRRAQEILLNAAPDAAAEIVSYARRAESLQARAAAIEVLGTLRDPVASELLAELVDDPDPELRTKVIKAAAAVADPCFLESFRSLLGDPTWSVRCQAATGLGAIGSADVIPDLARVLDDEAWWVRFNAATALAELGVAGRAALAEATTDDDERRRGVAEYVLLRTAPEAQAA